MAVNGVASNSWIVWPVYPLIVWHLHPFIVSLCLVFMCEITIDVVDRISCSQMVVSRDFQKPGVIWSFLGQFLSFALDNLTSQATFLSLCFCVCLSLSLSLYHCLCLSQFFIRLVNNCLKFYIHYLFNFYLFIELTYYMHKVSKSKSEAWMTGHTFARGQVRGQVSVIQRPKYYSESWLVI